MTKVWVLPALLAVLGAPATAALVPFRCLVSPCKPFEAKCGTDTECVSNRCVDGQCGSDSTCAVAGRLCDPTGPSGQCCSASCVPAGRQSACERLLRRELAPGELTLAESAEPDSPLSFGARCAGHVGECAGWPGSRHPTIRSDPLAVRPRTDRASQFWSEKAVAFELGGAVAAELGSARQMGRRLEGVAGGAVVNPDAVRDVGIVGFVPTETFVDMDKLGLFVDLAGTQFCVAAMESRTELDAIKTSGKPRDSTPSFFAVAKGGCCLAQDFVSCIRETGVLPTSTAREGIVLALNGADVGNFAQAQLNWERKTGITSPATRTRIFVRLVPPGTGESGRKNMSPASVAVPTLYYEFSGTETTTACVAPVAAGPLAGADSAVLGGTPAEFFAVGEGACCTAQLPAAPGAFACGVGPDGTFADVKSGVVSGVVDQDLGGRFVRAAHQAGARFGYSVAARPLFVRVGKV